MAAPEPENDPMRKLFDKLDKDGSGGLDKDELWCKMSYKGDEFATQMINMVDKNGDEVVDFGEFCAAFQTIKGFAELMDAEVIELSMLKTAMEQAWKDGKTPLICDPSGKADQFLAYGPHVLDAKGLFVLDKIHKKKTEEEITEAFRAAIVNAMKYGQPLAVCCGKAAPDLSAHVAAVGVVGKPDDANYKPGVFGHGFAAVIKDADGKTTRDDFMGIIKDDEKEGGYFFPKGDWTDGGGLIITTQFEREDYKEFLSGSFPDWPWTCFKEIVIKAE